MRDALRSLTPRGLGVAASVVGAWATGRLLGVAELQMAAVAAAALLLAAVVGVSSTGTSLRATRRVAPARLFHEARGAVELTLTNTGSLPTGTLAVADSVPASVATSHGFVLGPLSPGATARLRYEVVGRGRGVHDVGPLEVRVRDPFGLVALPRTVGGSDRLVVYPPVHRLPAGLPLSGRPGGGGSGRNRPGQVGDELSTVREYVRGDDLRKVHWAATAHRGALMVRQDETPQQPDAVLVLDTRAAQHRGRGPGSSLEVAVSAAASVAYHLAERGYATSLETDRRQGPALAVPWQATLERLAGVQTSDADLRGLWRQLAVAGGGGSGVLVAVTCVPDPELLRRMARAGRGAAVRVALLVDADAHAGRPRAGEPERAAAALGSAGWRAAVLRPGERVADRWRELVAGRVAGGART